MFKSTVMAMIGFNAVSPSLASDVNKSDIDVLIEKLDVTSFPNSVGPRQETGKSTFTDYGFVDIKKTTHGATLTRRDRTWMMGFDMLSQGAEVIEICFYDRRLDQPGGILASGYDATSALRIDKSKQGLWKAAQVQDGILNCKNNPAVE